MPAKEQLLDRTRQVSRRQRQIIELVALGLKNCEIGAELGIGAHVVRNYLVAIYAKIGLKATELNLLCGMKPGSMKAGCARQLNPSWRDRDAKANALQSHSRSPFRRLVQRRAISEWIDTQVRVVSKATTDTNIGNVSFIDEPLGDVNRV